MKDKYTRIVIVEDDYLIRESYNELINGSKNFICTGAYDNCEEAIRNLKDDKPEIILMDIGLPGISGIEGIQRIRKMEYNADIIVITVHDNDEKVFDALCAGATGYLTKNVTPIELLNAVESVISGGSPMSSGIARMVIRSFQKSIESPLTPRETEILRAFARGKSYSMIANDLFINKETVRSHIKNIYLKLNVHSKAEAIDKASRERLI